MTENTKHRLSQIRLFEDLPLKELRNVELQARWWQVNAGEQIIDRDSDNQEVFFVVLGSVRVVNYSTSGREIAFANFQQGDFFGEIAAIDGQRRSATVLSVTKCVLASIAPDTFRHLVNQYPSLAMSVLRRFAGIIRIADDRIMDLSTLRAVQRVYLELLRLVAPDAAVPGLWVIRPMLSHSVIASQVGTTRETVARVMGQLAAAKIVERKAKALYIRDKEALEKLAATLSPEGMIAPKIST